MVVRNRIAECKPYLGKVRYRTLDEVCYITLHRADPAEMSKTLGTQLTQDIVGIAKGDSLIPQVGGLAYPLAVLADGTIEQGRELTHCTPHSRRRNATGLAVCIVGNPDKEPPPQEQWAATVELVAMLCREFTRDVSYTEGCDELGICVEGHDEVNGGSADASKRCPGQFWPMRNFREAVKARLADMRGDGLIALGIVL